MMTSTMIVVGQNGRLMNSVLGLNLELPFTCQIDEKNHSALEFAYWCKKCDIYICASCFTSVVSLVGLTTCHHCHDGVLNFIFNLAKLPLALGLQKLVFKN